MELNATQERILSRVLIIFMLASAAYIVYYYWSVDTLAAIKVLPMHVIIPIFVYLGSQVAKRYLIKTMEWFDWVYYAGLIAIVAPLIFKKETGDWLHLLTDYGSLLLLVPPVVGGYFMIKSK